MKTALEGGEVPLTLDKHWDRNKGACPYTWRDVAWLYDEFDENFCKGVCNARGENGTTVLHSACKVMQIERVNKILAWESELAKVISNHQPTETEKKTAVACRRGARCSIGSCSAAAWRLCCRGALLKPGCEGLACLRVGGSTRRHLLAWFAGTGRWWRRWQRNRRESAAVMQREAPFRHFHANSSSHCNRTHFPMT